MFMQILETFLEYERNFKGQVWIDYTLEHAEIPIFVVSIYLVIVFRVPEFMETHNIKLDLRRFTVVWNILLAVFSIVGMMRTVPHLYWYLREKGFESTVCIDPNLWYLDGASGMWVGLFIYSKIPELIDTVFLVLRRRPVIFLHWFHHLTVLLYCWHAYQLRIAPGLWFAAMNYSVHSVMYTYYACMAARLHHIVAPFAIFITTAQILQMVVGAAVTVASGWRHMVSGPASCAVDPANYKMGFAMYMSYFVLFFSLFYKKYGVKTKPVKTTLIVNSGSSGHLCGVDLKNGDTTGRFNDGLDKNK